MTPSHFPCFVADSTLGKLAKYLRLAGFDTRLAQGVPNARQLLQYAGGHRTILTRSHKVKQGLGAARSIFIEHDDPLVQMGQVVSALGLDRRTLSPLSRCAACNRTLTPLDKEDARGRVPDHVWRQHDHFQTCPLCARVFWPGTHTQRWLVRMTAAFPPSSTAVAQGSEAPTPTS